MQKVYTNIIEIAGDVISVEAEGVGYLDIAEVTTRMGEAFVEDTRGLSFLSTTPWLTSP